MMANPLAFIDLAGLSNFHLACLGIAVGMLFRDTIEVGRNDAANLVNAVLGARVMARRTAIVVAGVAVIAGAALSSDVIDTARKGIFDPNGVEAATKAAQLNAVLAIYVTVYIVDTVLLYSYSSFGMPVSTTACLVFSLLGAAAAVDVSTIRWDNAGKVMLGIFCSIVLSGFAAFLVQRAARGAIRQKVTKLQTLLLHGGWIGGGLMAGLCYFLLLKGMKNVAFVKRIKEGLEGLDEALDADVSRLLLIATMWIVFAVLIHLALVIFKRRAARLLFPVLAVLGMIAMAFAFGQNDLANCASPGLAAYTLLQQQDVAMATEAPISRWLLLCCGGLLFFGMTTKTAQRVTKAAISTGSMGDHVALWAPQWCVSIAGKVLRFRGRAPALAPRAGITESGKTIHFDTLRACVITSVSASVIATASSLGLPVSTTYVAFAAIVATGMADRIFQRGDAELKMGRAIWVVTSWMLSAIIATVAAFCVAATINKLAIFGIAICIAVNLVVRRVLKKRADRQLERVEEEAYERAHPDEFALEQEDV